jgi:TM2 domain-containing membrane protein YozV
MTENDFFSVFFCLVGLLFFGLFIALVVTAVNKNKQEILRMQQQFNTILQAIPSDKQMPFLMQYESVKKNSTTAVLLALFLGGLGAHKFYMGQPGWGIVYILFVWTYIPSIVALIEAFMLPNQIRRYNIQKASEIALMLGIKTGGFVYGAF